MPTTASSLAYLTLMAAGGVRAPAMLEGCGAAIGQLRAEIEHATTRARAEHEVAVTRQRGVDRALAAVARLAEVDDAATACSESAEAYLSTGARLLGGDGSATLEIIGNAGGGTLSFVSGTPMGEMIASINAIRDDSGVSAAQSLINPERIELRSRGSGADQFVMVRQIEPSAPAIVFGEAEGGGGTMKVEDFGADGRAGDADCDGHVGMTDVVAVLRAWGACPGCPADVDGNGVVDEGDVMMVLELWDG